jgi:hypothetical protein
MCNERCLPAHLGLRLPVTALPNPYNRHQMLPVHQFDLMILLLILPPWTGCLRAVLMQSTHSMALRNHLPDPFLVLYSSPSASASCKSLRDARIMENVSPYGCTTKPLSFLLTVSRCKDPPILQASSSEA